MHECELALQTEDCHTEQYFVGLVLVVVSFKRIKLASGTLIQGEQRHSQMLKECFPVVLFA